MKMAATESQASLISEAELNEEFVIPRPIDPRVADVVAKAVADKAIEQGLAKVNL